MFPHENIENDAVDRVIDAVICEHAHARAFLAVAVDAAFALLVAGGVPRKIIMHDGVEIILKVDSLAETVCAYKHALWIVCEFEDARFTVGRRKIAGNGCNGDILWKHRFQLFSQVFSCGNEATEYYRVIAVSD